MECQLEVQKRSDVLPLFGDLTLINAGHKFECCDCVFTGFSVEIQKFDDFSLHCNFGVGLDLPGQIRSVIIALIGWLNILDVLFVETGASSDLVAI